MKTILSAVVLLSLFASVAHAECDGPPPVRGTAHQRLNMAREAIDQGRNGYAFRLTRTIPGLDEATPADVAEAHAISALVYWKNGDVKHADGELADASKSDDSAARTYFYGLKDGKLREALQAEMDKLPKDSTVAVAAGHLKTKD